MSNKKQNSVEWLHEQLTLTWYDFNSSKDLLEQAKAMHKEEISNAFSYFGEDYIDEKHCEEYYKETFNSNET